MRLVALALMALISGSAFANNLFIPNSYRNRRAPNEYAAVGWSARNEASLVYSRNTTDRDTVGTKTSEKSANGLSAFVFDRVNENINIEGLLGYGDQKSESMTTHAFDTEKSTTGWLSGGYEFSAVPVALGVTYWNFITDSRDGTTNEVTTSRYHSLSVGAGYRLLEDFYVGAGVRNTRSTFPGQGERSRYNYVFGIGKVFGDRKAPSGNIEAHAEFQNDDGTQTQTLNVSGLVNVGDFQPYGSVEHNRVQGQGSGSNLELKAGVDYQFFDFFVAPEVKYQTRKTDADNYADNVLTDYALMVGYRTSRIEAYVSVGKSERKSEYGGIIGTFANSKENETEYTAGLTYKF